MDEAVFGRFKRFYRKHSRAFAGAITVLVIVAWLLGPALFDFLTLGQSFLLSFTILAVLLGFIQEYLDEIAKPTDIRVGEGQNENNFAIMEALSGETIDSVRMIEYDSESTKALIFFFLAKGASVHCLLQHPDAAVSESQRRRVIFQIVTRHEEYSGYLDRIRFDYYKDQASLRGRLIDNRYVSLGWYTYDQRSGFRGRQIWGHNNPVLLAPSGGEGGRVLAQFFERTFDNLLANSESWEDLASQYDLYIRRRRAVSTGELVLMEAKLSELDQVGSDGPVAELPHVRLSEYPIGDLPAGLATECLPILSSAFDDRHWNHKAVQDAVLTAATCKWVILARSVDDQKLVGMSTVHSTSDPKTAKLHWVGVDTAWRGGGIGKALVQSACRRAAEGGAERIVLRTESYRIAAMSMYQTLGFRYSNPADEVVLPIP